MNGQWMHRNVLSRTWRFLFIFAAFAVILSGRPALAGTYDDFSSGKIQDSKWKINDPNGFFSVVPGSSVGVSQRYVLEISGSGSDAFPKGSLRTTKTFSGKLAAGINFFNFTSDYTPPASDPNTPSVSLLIYGGPSDNIYLVVRSHSTNGNIIGFKETDSTGATVYARGGVPYPGDSGALLLAYAGNQLSLGFSTSTNPDDWLDTFTVVATFQVSFTASPRLLITASGGGGGTMSVDVGELYTSSKLPAVPTGISGTYDDFSSGEIQASRWTIADTDNLFSVVPGSSAGISQPYVLQFSGAGTPSFPRSHLLATRPFGGNVFAGINFFNFTSDYTPAADDQFNPSIGLRVLGGATDPRFIVSRTHSSSGHFIGWRKEDVDETTIAKAGSAYTDASGAVLVAYINNQLSLGYSTSTDPADWATSFRAVATFEQPFTAGAVPTLQIRGSAGAGGSVSADVGGFYYSSQTPALSVALSGTGSGRVTSSTGGIDCGTTCMATYKKGAKVTLTPAPENGSVFAGWTGACKGSGTCTVTVKGDITVGAIFNTGTCTYAISSKGKTVTYKGGTITLGITAGTYTYCTEPEITVGSPDWITYTASAFAKNKGSIKITVSPYHYSSVITGTVTVAGNTFTVTRTGAPCTFNLNSASSDLFPATQSTGSFTVTATPEDCAWSTKMDAKSAAWITIDSGAMGTGSGPVNYTVLLNTTGKVRNGKITVIVSKKNKAYTVRQDK